MNPVVCCGPVELAEAALVEAATMKFNVSRGEAVRTCTQRRELGAVQRVAAELLILEWEGTSKQCELAHRLAFLKSLAT